VPERWGYTVPAYGLADGPEVTAALEAAGYTDAWSSESAGADAFSPLVATAVRSSTLRLGTAIVPAFTRGPALVAQSAAAVAAHAPGRFVLGIGASSPAIVGAWNGMAFDKPFQRTRDLLRFLRPALAGEKVDAAYDTFSVRGFRLATPPPEPPPIYLAALREGMLRLAGAEADGVILNWLAPGDVARCRGVAEEAAAGRPIEVVARLFVVPTADAQRARFIARRAIAAYLTVPAYAAFHEWLGRGDQLRGLWDHWAKGDRKAALAAIPDAVVDDLVTWGEPAACRERLAAYAAAGIDTPIVAVIDPEADPMAIIPALGPAR
jgi:probable F420-dependent oxidoreductase